MKKRITILLIIPILVLVPVAVARAVDTTVRKNDAQETRLMKVKADRIESLKKRAEREIDRRIAALNLLTKKIDGIKRLTADEKAAYLTDIEKNITDLNELKVQIMAETDVVRLKAEVQSIVKTYRIFALYMPKIHLLAAAGVVTETTDKLNTLADKLEIRINEQEAAGNDVTELNADLAEMKAKIADAKAQAEKVLSTVIPVTASGYPGNNATLRSAFDALKTARADIVSAKQKSRGIIKDLKALDRQGEGQEQNQE